MSPRSAPSAHSVQSARPATSDGTAARSFRRGHDPVSAPPQLTLDPIACVGHGLCAELFPEGVVLDDWGFPILLPEAQDPSLREHAKRAAKACPALALKLRARGWMG